MALKKFKPTTPSLRFTSVADYSSLTTKKPEKSLTKGKKRINGRNFQGTITVRHRGGGHKRRYRIIDFKQKKHDVFAEIKTIEYDPNRSAFISLIEYTDGEKAYILSPLGIKLGQQVVCGLNVRPDLGNRMPLRNIPTGMEIYNIELSAGRGGQIVRSAGVSARIMAKEGNYCSVKLPSGEVKMIHRDCFASVGRLSNHEQGDVSLGKAGRKRWLGFRPTVRGTAMNPVDHPHGGGEGRTKGRHPVTPWGKPTKGYKTRKGKKYSDDFIVQKRKSRKGR
ncbi:large ribosomal subunit protein uL2-like [Periplaneta americana]|uniref:large ribosomal subunit protein uL2-like n=1 Tax=Periplaneta americana TaxID=6978 RepID=UPI0037E93FEA